MLIIKNISVEGRDYPVTISDDSEALQAAYAAGGAIIGIWKPGDSWSMPGCLYLITEPEDADEKMLERVVRRRLGLPWLIGETKRLLIREFKTEDPLESQAESKDGGIFSNKEKRDAYISSQYWFHECGLWALVKKATGELIGKAGVLDGELSYHIYEPYRRRGYGFEACREIIKYAEREWGCQRFFAKIEKGNEASIALAQKLGFTPAQGAGGNAKEHPEGRFLEKREREKPLLLIYERIIKSEDKKHVC